MKKNFLILISLFIFIPFVVNAETCDMDKVTIESVTVKEKTDNVTEVEQPIIEGKTIKVNLKMLELNDTIEYKMVVKNDSNEDYELDRSSLNANSDYIEYTLNTDDNNLIVKAGKSKEVFLKVKYKNTVPATAYTDGKYIDDKNISLNLSNQLADTISNPKTGKSTFVLFFVCVLFLGFITFIIISKKKYNKLMIILLGIMITVPISVYALCKAEFNIESNVTIEMTTNEPEVTKYDIAYFNNSYGFYTDSELEKSERINNTNFNTRCSVIYVGETKYNKCINLILKDDTKYAEGATVTLKPITIKNYSDLSSCTEQGDGSLQCPSSIQNDDYTINVWHYDNLWNDFGYNYETTDKQIMNFNDYIYDYWDDEGWFGVTVPQTFTMPGHSILFARYIHE